MSPIWGLISSWVQTQATKYWVQYFREVHTQFCKPNTKKMAFSKIVHAEFCRIDHWVVKLRIHWAHFNWQLFQRLQPSAMLNVGQFRIANWLNVYVSGMWDETEVSWKTKRQGEHASPTHTSQMRFELATSEQNVRHFELFALLSILMMRVVFTF